MLSVSINRDDGKKLYKLKILKVNDTYMEVGFPGSLSRYGINLVIKKINGSSGYSSHNLLVLIWC
jgi:hypothetical protein